MESLVPHLTLALQKIENLIGIARLGSIEEQPRFLLYEPSSQVLISTVGQPANEVRDVVVLGLLTVEARLLLHGKSFVH